MSLTSLYSFAKALHLIGMVSWLAGLFYLVRIMVYHAEALGRPATERSLLAAQFNGMEWKAYRVILRPAVVITWTCGVLMLCIQPMWLQQGWLHVKLVFLLLLTGYTHYCQSHIRRLESGTNAFTHLQYRAMNEMPTILLLGIVFLGVFKTSLNWTAFVVGVVGFGALIFSAVRRANRR